MFFGLCFFTIATLLVPHGGLGDETLVVGVFPRRSAVMTRTMFTPMINRLAKELNMRVRVRSAKNFKMFWQGVVNGEYDLVHFNQYHYIISKARYGYQVIAMNEEQGRSSISGVIVVRKDANINSVEDLRGKKILFGGGPRAMMSYISTRYLLEQAGLKANQYETVFERNPQSAVVAVYHGLGGYAAAGAGDAILMPVSKHVNFDEMKVLVQGEAHAHLPWAVKKNMPDELRKRISWVLTHLKDSRQGRQALQKAKLTNIITATDSDYDPHRVIIKAVYNEDY